MIDNISDQPREITARNKISPAAASFYTTPHCHQSNGGQHDGGKEGSETAGLLSSPVIAGSTIILLD